MVYTKGVNSFFHVLEWRFIVRRHLLAHIEAKVHVPNVPTPLRQVGRVADWYENIRVWLSVWVVLR
jgi:hypothetical protein